MPGAVGIVAARTAAEVQGQELTEMPPSMTRIGAPFRGYGAPSRFEQPVQRIVAQPMPQIAPGTGASRTPIHALQGSITPSGLHFERHHNGVPDIDPKAHRVSRVDSADAHGRQLLALRDDALRLHAPLDADQRTAIANER